MPSQPRQGSGIAHDLRDALQEWESRIDRDPHDAPPGHHFTHSVERRTGDRRDVLAEGLPAAIAEALESAIYTLDALLAHVLGEGTQ